MLTLRPINIDFSDQPEAASWRSRLFMIVTLGIFSLSLAHYSDMSAKLKAANDRVTEISTQLGLQHKTSYGADRTDGDKHAQVEESVNIEWDRMLSSIENATTQDVAVIAVQANPKKKLVTVTGEARSYSHAIEFVQKLSDKKAFSNAYLTSHTIAENDPDQPVDFVAEAIWVTH